MRHEMKFRIDLLQYEKLNGMCRRLLQTDPHAEKGVYQVKSLYFDTPARKDYHDTMAGAYARHKIRLRTYGGAHPIYRLEQKYKRGSLSAKRSVILSEEQAVQVSKGDYTCLAGLGEDGNILYHWMTTQGYQPMLTVWYLRDAFYMDTENFRLTLDSQVSYGMPQAFWEKNALPLVYPGGRHVLEIKYDSFMPMWIMREVKKSGVQLETNSKYCQGMQYMYGMQSY